MRPFRGVGSSDRQLDGKSLEVIRRTWILAGMTRHHMVKLASLEAFLASLEVNQACSLRAMTNVHQFSRLA